jgi:DNA-binding transcriptional ArsR family regulator
MNIEAAISALNNPIRRQIVIWLKHRSNFLPPLPEHEDVKGVCIGYIQEKAGLSQSTISNYMGKLKKAGLVNSERHGQWTFFSRNEDAIQAFVAAVEAELLSP